MPSNTFLNLPNEKQEKILQAAVIEFSENPFSEVSINKIIKSAEISRGSFYTYFEDKYDLLVYLLTRFKNHMKNQLDEMTVSVKGNLNDLILLIHEHIFGLFQNHTNKKFLYNVIVYFQTHSDEELKNHRDQLPFLGECEDLYRILDLKQFKFNTEKEIKQSIDIAFAIFKNILFITALRNLDYNQSKTLLKEYLNILQQGYYKEKKNA